MSSLNSNQATLKGEDVRANVDSEQALDTPEKTDQQPDASKAFSRPPAPDGGMQAWLTVLGSFCVLFCSFGWINSVGVFQGYYQEVMLTEYSASTIAWIPSLQIFFMFFSSPFTGRIFDVYGPRYLLLGGSFLHVFGLMMASISTEYYQLLLAQGICSAIGVSAIFQPGWFDKKIGIAFGIGAAGSSLGGVLFPIMVNEMIQNVGYGWAMRTGAFVILALLIVANLTIRARFPPNPRPLTKELLLAPWKEIKMVLVMGGFLLLTFGVFIPIDYIQVEALNHGMSYDLAQYLVPILNAGSLFGRLGAGALGDKIGVYNIIVVVCYMSGILILSLWMAAASNAALIVFAALFGFTTGAYVALAAPLVIKISPLPQIGFRSGLLFFVASFGGLTGNPIAGAIVSDWNGSYTGVKIFSGVMLLAGTTVILTVRIIAVGFKPSAIF